MGVAIVRTMRTFFLFNIAAVVLYTTALPSNNLDADTIVPEEALVDLEQQDTDCHLPPNQLGYWIFSTLIPDQSHEPGNGWHDANGILQYTSDCRMQLQINFPHGHANDLKYSGYATPAEETHDPQCFYHQVLRSNNSFPVGSALARCAVISADGNSLTLVEWYANNSHTHGFSHADAASHWIKPTVDQLEQGDSFSE